MNIRERFVLVRKHLGLKQVEFAEALATSQSAISRIESGFVEPSGQDKLILQLLYNVNKTWLETGEGEMFEIRKEMAVEDSKYLLARLRLLSSEINYLIDNEFEKLKNV